MGSHSYPWSPAEDPTTLGIPPPPFSAIADSGTRPWSISSSLPPRAHAPVARRLISATSATETETEDERNLPTSRKAPQQLATPTFMSKILPSIFLAFRLLSIVPASVAILVHAWNLYRPPECGPNNRVEYALSILWAVLTAHQCLSLTTGLFHRWRVYYSLFPTLIRLLALQAICWPATHLTLKLFNHEKRPLVCWTIIGTTTCFSKAIEMWVTSNLRLSSKETGIWSVRGLAVWVVGELGNRHPMDSHTPSIRNDAMGHIKPRRWNWNRVLAKCVAPPCVIYVVMAWALLVKREFEPNISRC